MLHVKPEELDLIAAAYDIAYGYLKGSGRVWSNQVTHDVLMAKMIGLYSRGERNKIKLANRCISEYEKEMDARTLTVFCGPTGAAPRSRA